MLDPQHTGQITIADVMKVVEAPGPLPMAPDGGERPWPAQPYLVRAPEPAEEPARAGWESGGPLKDATEAEALALLREVEKTGSTPGPPPPAVLPPAAVEPETTEPEPPKE